MDTKFIEFLKKPSTRRWGIYLAKAAVLLALLYAFSLFVPVAQPFVIAFLWAALSVVSAIGLTYHTVVRKTHKQLMLKEGGRLARLNSGRVFSFIGSFVVSAVLIAGLFLESPKWDVGEWVLVICAVPVYLGVFLLFDHILGGEYEPTYRVSRSTFWSGVIVGVLLTGAYLVMLLVQPPVVYESASDAFLAAQRPFAESPSALLVEFERFSAFLGGFTEFGIAKAGEVSPVAYAIWRLVINASAFFGVANLVSMCSLEWRELKKVFLPLAKPDEPDAASEVGDANDADDGNGASEPKPVQRPIRKYVIEAAVLPLCLMVAFLAVDSNVAQFMSTEEGAAVEQFVEDQTKVAVYVLDGKYYDEQEIRNLIAYAQEQSEELAAEARMALVPLINESFDARIANVDSYLDWYYSLGADYERLLTLATGDLESYMQDQFETYIEAGIDDTRLLATYDDYKARGEALEADLASQLAGLEVTDVPVEQLEIVGTLGPNFLDKPAAPSQKFVEGYERLGLSVVAGVAGGLLAKRLAARVIEKQVFKTMVSKVAEFLAARGLGATVGNAGAVFGPLGWVAAQLAIGVGVDYGLLKLDELQNRETYKAELVEAIEEERAEWLAAVGAA